MLTHAGADFLLCSQEADQVEFSDDEQEVVWLTIILLGILGIFIYYIKFILVVISIFP